MADSLLESVGFEAYRKQYDGEDHKTSLKAVMLSLSYIEENFDLEKEDLETIRQILKKEPQEAAALLKKLVDEIESEEGLDEEDLEEDDLEETEATADATLEEHIQTRLLQLFNLNQAARQKTSYSILADAVTKLRPSEELLKILTSSDDTVVIVNNYARELGIKKDDGNVSKPAAQQPQRASNHTSRHKSSNLLTPFLALSKKFQYAIGAVILLIMVLGMGLSIFWLTTPSTPAPATADFVVPPPQEQLPTAAAQPEPTTPVVSETQPEQPPADQPAGEQTVQEVDPNIQKYEVWLWKTSDAAIGVKGRSGPGSTYPEIMEALPVDQYVRIVKFDPDSAWTIALPMTGGAGFYPSNIFKGEPQGDLQTGEVAVLPLEAVDHLLASAGGATKSTGTVVSPLVQWLVGILALAAIYLILREAYDRNELGDGVFSILQAFLMVIMGVSLPLLAQAVIESTLRIGTQQEVQLPYGITEQIITTVTLLASRLISVMIIAWSVWEAISPIMSEMYDDDTDEWQVRWFPRIDFTPVGNTALIAGLLGFIGVPTVLSLAFNAQANERLTNLRGIVDGIASQQAPSLAGFSIIMLLIAIAVYVLDNLRAGQFMAALVGTLASGSYYFFRVVYDMEPYVSLPIALLISGAVIGIMFAVPQTRGQVRSMSRASNVLLTVVAIAAFSLVSFGTF